jgi:DNA-binding NarL/FixJ family response regulator
LIKSDGKIRTLLADDHAVMREGLARPLGQKKTFLSFAEIPSRD